MRGLCPLLSEWCNEVGGEGEKGHPAQNLQRVDDTVDEGERKNLKGNSSEMSLENLKGINRKEIRLNEKDTFCVNPPYVIHLCFRNQGNPKAGARASSRSSCIFFSRKTRDREDGKVFRDD
jgi:hypothetical protein